MPPAAFGNYIAVATLPGKDGPEEICSTAFFYFPVLRVFGIVLGIGMIAALLVRPWRRKLALRLWLAVPPVIALFAYLFLPNMGMWDGYRGFWLQQACCLSIALALICRFRKRRRIISSLLIIMLDILGTAVLYGSLYGTSYIVHLVWYIISGSLPLSVPVLVALLVSIPRLTRTRLAISLLVSWLVASGVAVAYASSQGMPLTMQFVLPFLLSVLPHHVIFFALAGFNRDCATGLKRAFGTHRAE